MATRPDERRSAHAQTDRQQRVHAHGAIRGQRLVQHGEQFAAARPRRQQRARGRGVDADRSQEVGATDSLAKPVSERDLLARIEQLLSAAGAAAGPRERAPGRAQTATDDLPNPA